AVIGNLIGALHALVPEISIVAVPTGGHMEDVHVERCLEAVRDARQPYLDICTHEQPLAACTARTFQRLMQGALSQKWWPLIHNAEGTPGSIDLGYKYDELMDALACSSKGSCLEKGLGDLDSEDLKSVLENGTTSERERFAELQCSFAGNRVDTEDSETGKLPVFSDKIWIAALKAHGASMEMEPSEVHPCPRVVPFVVAFCASSLGCMEDADNAGKGFYELPDFQNARSRAEAQRRSISHMP
ncbi:ada, partial [Symbiodinium pilosum]